MLAIPYSEASLDVIVCGKMPTPFNPEAGFSAVTPNGTITLNKPLIKSLFLTDAEIREPARMVLEEIKRVERMFQRYRLFPNFRNRAIILTDARLASGFTILSAATFVSKYEPTKVVIAVSTASLELP